MGLPRSRRFSDAGAEFSPAGSDEPEPLADGSLGGSVLIARELSSRKMRFRPYLSSSPAGARPVGAPVIEVQNVVVYLELGPSSEAVIAGAGRHVMRQANETFVPHVLPVLRGRHRRIPQ
jgi:hypothetical protein